MRERRYSPKEVEEQVDKLVQDLKKNQSEWRKMPYRYICLFCGIPLRSAQAVLIRLRAHPNIEYRYQESAVKIPTAICHYIDEDKNTIRKEEFAQFTDQEFTYLTDRFAGAWESEHELHMLALIFVELLLLNGFRDAWKDLPFGFYAVAMGLETDMVEAMAKDLENLKVLKRLGMSRMFRLALSEEEYEVLEKSAYVKQQDEIVERSRRIVEQEDIPTTPSEQFTVLTELNTITDVTKKLLENTYRINESIVRSQMELRASADALHALQEKESVYAGMATRIAAISKNYEQAISESKELRARNAEMKHIQQQYDKYYKERAKIITQNLESMLGQILSAMEEYFSLPIYEKKNPVNSNRTKTQITRIVMDTIEQIEKGKSLS